MYIIVERNQIEISTLNGLAPLSNTISNTFFELINTLGVAVPTSHHWPLGDAILGLNPSGLVKYIPPSHTGGDSRMPLRGQNHDPRWTNQKGPNLKPRKTNINKLSPKKFRLFRKWGAAPFAAVFSPLWAQIGKYVIWHPQFSVLKRAPVLYAGAVYGNMTPWANPCTWICLQVQQLAADPVVRFEVSSETWTMEQFWRTPKKEES